MKANYSFQNEDYYNRYARYARRNRQQLASVWNRNGNWREKRGQRCIGIIMKLYIVFKTTRASRERLRINVEPVILLASFLPCNYSRLERKTDKYNKSSFATTSSPCFFFRLANNTRTCLVRNNDSSTASKYIQARSIFCFAVVVYRYLCTYIS